MLRFRSGPLPDPLLPAQAASVIRPVKPRVAKSWAASLLDIAPVVMISGILFTVVLYVLMVCLHSTTIKFPSTDFFSPVAAGVQAINMRSPTTRTIATATTPEDLAPLFDSGPIETASDKRKNGANAIDIDNDTHATLLGRTRPRSRELEQRLNALIEEAAQGTHLLVAYHVFIDGYITNMHVYTVAKEKGILTEVDAAEKKKERENAPLPDDWTWLLLDIEQQQQQQQQQRQQEVVKELQQQKQQQYHSCSPSAGECGPHGVCGEGRCHCAAAFTGKYCGHSVLVSHPFIPPESGAYGLGYEGNFLLTRGSQVEEWWNGPNTEEGPFPMEDLKAVQPYLPLSDDLLKGKVHDRCAVVGPGASLLLGPELGATIDGNNAVVFRVGIRQPKYQEKRTGVLSSPKNVYVAARLVEGWMQVAANGPLVTSTSKESVATLSASGVSSSKAPYMVHPLLELHMANAFALAPGAETTGPGPGPRALLLAINVCRSVTVYGMAPLMGAPGTMDAPCTVSPMLHRDWPLVRGIVESGVVDVGEKCVRECAVEVGGVVGGAKGRKQGCEECRVAAGIVMTSMVPCPPPSE